MCGIIKIPGSKQRLTKRNLIGGLIYGTLRIGRGLFGKYSHAEKGKGNGAFYRYCNALGFSKPSVSRAMSILKNSGLIVMDESGLITLTEAGMAAAERVYERHNIISEYLEKFLGVSRENALGDACKIEHDLSEETYSKIKDIVLGRK